MAEVKIGNFEENAKYLKKMGFLMTILEGLELTEEQLTNFLFFANARNGVRT